MSDAFQTLSERGFVKQCTDPDLLSRQLATERVTFYAGFDPTADSLHIGHLLPIMAMAHVQRAGHHPVAVVGGGTAMVGDPSGKSEMRQLLSREAVVANAQAVQQQIARYLEFGPGKGDWVDNAEWLLPLNYVEFLRDIGRYFKVNEMIKVEAYRQRLEREEGLSFIEFNYQLLQSYDFLMLNRRYGCSLQIGGDDQWGNIVSGVDLIRRVDGKTAHGLTFPLIMTARGEKMGKTAAGAVWLSAERTSPYEFYQFWINTDDRDVERFLAYFTFLPMDEVKRLGSLEGAQIREAKEALAFEATRLSHGEVEAEAARAASHAAFGGGGDDLSSVPTTSLPRADLEAGLPLVQLLRLTGLADSNGAARRLIAGGGAYLNGEKVEDTEFVVGASHEQEGALLLRMGKKRFHRVVVEG